MILSDKTLQAMLSTGTLTITPLIEDQIQPASVDIRLGNTFSVVEDSPSGMINMENEIRYKTITCDTYILLPNQFVLATTLEFFDLPDDLTAFVEGRSSLGRMGLFIQNAGWVDPGLSLIHISERRHGIRRNAHIRRDSGRCQSGADRSRRRYRSADERRGRGEDDRYFRR